MCKSLVCHVPATKKVVISVVSFDIRYFLCPSYCCKRYIEVEKEIINETRAN